MTPMTMVTQNIEIRCRNFVIANFCTRGSDKETVPKKIKNMAEAIIHGTPKDHGDVIAAVRGMLAGVKMCAQDSHLNVQSALCEAGTAAYYTAMEHSRDLAKQVKQIAEGSYNDF